MGLAPALGEEEKKVRVPIVVSGLEKAELFSSSRCR